MLQIPELVNMLGSFLVDCVHQVNLPFFHFPQRRLRLACNDVSVTQATFIDFGWLVPVAPNLSATRTLLTLRTYLRFAGLF